MESAEFYAINLISFPKGILWLLALTQEIHVVYLPW